MTTQTYTTPPPKPATIPMDPDPDPAWDRALLLQDADTCACNKCNMQGMSALQVVRIIAQPKQI